MPNITTYHAITYTNTRVNTIHINVRRSSTINMTTNLESFIMVHVENEAIQSYRLGMKERK